LLASRLRCYKHFHTQLFLSGYTSFLIFFFHWAVFFFPSGFLFEIFSFRLPLSIGFLSARRRSAFCPKVIGDCFLDVEFSRQVFIWPSPFLFLIRRTSVLPNRPRSGGTPPHNHPPPPHTPHPPHPPPPPHPHHHPPPPPPPPQPPPPPPIGQAQAAATVLAFRLRLGIPRPPS